MPEGEDYPTMTCCSQQVTTQLTTTTTNPFLKAANTRQWAWALCAVLVSWCTLSGRGVFSRTQLHSLILNHGRKLEKLGNYQDINLTTGEA